MNKSEEPEVNEFYNDLSTLAHSKLEHNVVIVLISIGNLVTIIITNTVSTNNEHKWLPF